MEADQTDFGYLRYGFAPANGQRHAWVENPILEHGVKYYPVRRYTWFPHSEIVEYYQGKESAEEYCNAINCKYTATPASADSGNAGKTGE